MAVVLIHKPRGQTPLRAMTDWARGQPSLVEEPRVYAGRLDPMAEGALLVLTGEDRHALPAHLRHDKTYVATFLFGVSSDTGDGLGRVTTGQGVLPSVEDILAAVTALRGTHALPLPVWSSHRARGKPLWWWAQQGRLDEVEVPSRAMTVTQVAEVTARVVRAEDVAADMKTRIAAVEGNFRQEDALDAWEGVARSTSALMEATTALDVTSGTYVRALADLLGTRLGCGALLAALVRTRVGPYLLQADGTVDPEAVAG